LASVIRPCTSRTRCDDVGLDQAAQPRLALRPTAIGARPLGDVEGDADAADDRLVLIAERFDPRFVHPFVPGELILARLSFEGAQVGGDRRVGPILGVEVAVERRAEQRELARLQPQGAERPARAEGEAQVPVGHPHHGRQPVQDQPPQLIGLPQPIVRYEAVRNVQPGQDVEARLARFRNGLDRPVDRGRVASGGDQVKEHLG
jgi:hypothetical protein